MPESVKVGGVYLNDLRRFTALKTAADKFVVTPNNVTIDAYAMLDLTAEPIVIFVPALDEPRWYIVQVGDGFDEIARNIGGTKGPQPGVYLVTGPDYDGPVPGDMIQVKIRTKVSVIGLRILANGSADLPKAVAAQTGFALMPLSAYLREGLAHKPPRNAPWWRRMRARRPPTSASSTNWAMPCEASAGVRRRRRRAGGVVSTDRSQHWPRFRVADPRRGDRNWGSPAPS